MEEKVGGEGAGGEGPHAWSELRAANRDILIAGLNAQQQADESSHAYGRLESLLAGLEEGVLVVAASGHVVFVNDAARRILPFAARREQWDLADSRGEFAHGVDGTPLGPDSLPIARAQRGEQFTNYEIIYGPLEDPDTQRIQFSCNAVVDHDEVVAFVTCRDVTRLRQLEQMRDDFTALISHDLRNPLAIISAAAERLARQGTGQTNDELLETVGFIEQSARRMLAMIEQLVELAALESVRPKVEFEPVSILPLLRSIARRHDAGLTAPERLPIILGDALMIERVLVNLLTNAVKYSAPGSPVNIEIKQRDADVVISVTDVGRGISADDLESIFGRFYRVPDSAVGSPRGYGLGLYIARLMVEAHGGMIWAESTRHAGSTFSFSLPATDIGGPE